MASRTGKRIIAGLASMVFTFMLVAPGLRAADKPDNKGGARTHRQRRPRPPGNGQGSRQGCSRFSPQRMLRHSHYPRCHKGRLRDRRTHGQGPHDRQERRFGLERPLLHQHQGRERRLADRRPIGRPGPDLQDQKKRPRISPRARSRSGPMWASRSDRRDASSRPAPTRRSRPRYCPIPRAADCSSGFRCRAPRSTSTARPTPASTAGRYCRARYSKARRQATRPPSGN